MKIGLFAFAALTALCGCSRSQPTEPVKITATTVGHETAAPSGNPRNTAEVDEDIALCGGRAPTPSKLDEFGVAPLGATNLPDGVTLAAPCVDGDACVYRDARGVEYVKTDIVERKTVLVAHGPLPSALSPGLSPEDDLAAALTKLSAFDELKGRLYSGRGNQGDFLVTHYCFTNSLGTEFGIELSFSNKGELRKYSTYLLSETL